jgi:hypothetical protein
MNVINVGNVGNECENGLKKQCANELEFIPPH